MDSSVKSPSVCLPSSKFETCVFCLVIIVNLLLLCGSLYQRFDWYRAQTIRHLPFTETPATNTTLKSVVNETKIKTILLYNIPHNDKWIGTGKRLFPRNGCQFTRCKLFVNPYLIRKRPLESYDSIVFFIDAATMAFKMVKDLSKKSVKRKNSQKYVSVRFEPPVAPPEGYSVSRNLLTNFFNWSISYRQDADIRLPYGSFRQLKPEEYVKPNRTSYTKSDNQSSAIVAWMVSHCITDGRREDYVNELQKYIDVDVYGQCGNLNCKNKLVNESLNCYDMIESNYKFYLSFENSICPGYVSEKFFRIVQLTESVVPVVYGGADYASIAPPHSYIDARQFKPKELADYLKKLDANDTLFAEYLQWKGKYEIENTDQRAFQNAFCELCRKLHQDAESESVKIDSHVIDWYRPENTCIVDPII